MNMGKELEFDVMGCRIRFRPEADNQSDQLKAENVVEYVLKEAASLRSKNPSFMSLDDKQIAVLLALQFAREKLVLEKKWQEEFNLLRANTSQALQLIEEVCPSAH